MIINSQLGGKKPTGTKNIVTNGTHNVADYEYADVQVPTTAPDYYIEKTKDANNVLQPGTTLMNFSGLADIGNYALSYAYYGNTALSGAVDMSVLTKITGQYACQYMFSGATNITSVDLSNLENVSTNSCQNMFEGCTGLTSIDLSKVTEIKSSGFSNTFKGCTHLTNISLPSLKETKESACCVSMFQNCTGITSVNLSSLISISNTNTYSNGGCVSMFQGCTGLTSVDLSSLTNLQAASSCSNMFNGCTGLTSIDLSNLLMVSGNSACANMFYGCTNLASVNISRLAKLGTNNNLQQMFRNCTSLTELRFSGLPYTATNINSAFNNTLQGVTGCTVHFPSDWETAMANYSNITNGLGGTNTTVLFDLPAVTTLDLSHITEVKGYKQLSNLAENNYFANVTSFNLSNLTSISSESGCANMFNGCTNLTSINLPKLKTINGQSGADGMFRQNLNLTSANISNLTTILANYACSNMFYNCGGLTSIDLPCLTIIKGQSAAQSMFQGTGLASLIFPSLKVIQGVGAGQFMFRYSSGLTTISFPALKTASGSSLFNAALQDVTGCTVHFPSNLSSYQFNLGGTNTTVLYDLPATVILTGANASEYERNPRYDTASALAWRVKDGGTEEDQIIDWTPFYTSGTTDPQVGATIYSDSACTTAVTTISSIA